jgi:ribosomal protein S11
MWNTKKRRVPQQEVGLKRNGRRRRKRRKRRRRKKRKGRRCSRAGQEGRQRWCRVHSEATNRKIEFTWHAGRKRRRVLDERREGRRSRREMQKKARENPRSRGTERREKKRQNRRVWPMVKIGSASRGSRKKNGYILGRGTQSYGATAGSRGYQSVRQHRTDQASRKLIWGRRTNRKKRVGREKQAKPALHVRREGRWKGAKAALKTRKNCWVRSVTDRTREAHNGCHGKKRRRK